MGFLRFAKEPTGDYFILGHNDEELYVVGELLLDNEARTIAKKISNTDESQTAKSGRFQFKTHPYHLIDIKFLSKGPTKDEDHILEIDIDSLMLEDIIDEWDFFMLSKPTELVLTRRNDTDVIELSAELFEE
jgi:hypothetical protein